jgi:hypothetical protein
VVVKHEIGYGLLCVVAAPAINMSAAAVGSQLGHHQIIKNLWATLDEEKLPTGS